MPTIKKRNHSLKRQPEQEIRTIWHNVTEFIAVRRQYVTTITLVVAAAVILFAGYSLSRSLQEQKAAPLVASAYEFYGPTAGASPDFVKALELYREAQKKYPSTMSGAISQYYIGNCLMNLDRTEEALKEYDAFVRKYSSEKFLLGLVYERMGYLYRALDRQPEAIKSFAQSDALIGPGVSTVELARLYEASGNVVASQQKYKEISDKLAGTAWAMEATGKVQKIAPAPMSSPPPKEGK